MTPAEYSVPVCPDPDRPVTVGGADQFVAAWVARELNIDPAEFGPCSAMGVVLGGSLVAGIVFNEYVVMRAGSSIQASIASTSPHWASRPVLRDIFRYPFEQLGVSRLWASTAKGNKRARRFLLRLGFKLEGVARRGYDGTRDAAVYSLMPHECRWLGRD